MPLSKKIRFEVFKRDNFSCQYCGRTAKEKIVLEVDHLIALCSGGDNAIENLITACFDCNRGKGKRALDNRFESENLAERVRILKAKKKSLRRIYKLREDEENIKANSLKKIVSHWNDRVSSHISPAQLSSVRRFLNDFTPEEIIEAIDIANSKRRFLDETQSVWVKVFNYSCGILKNWKAERTNG